MELIAHGKNKYKVFTVFTFTKFTSTFESYFMLFNIYFHILTTFDSAKLKIPNTFALLLGFLALGNDGITNLNL